MSKGLDYFQKVYDQVPGWVQKMHDYSPQVLDHYTAIRGEIMDDGPVLSRKQKDALIASMNAARLYPRSMVYHTKGTIDHGLTVAELIEYFLVAYLYKGFDAIKMSVEAVQYAKELSGEKVDVTTDELNSEEAILSTYKAWLEDADTSFIDRVLDAVKTNDANVIEETILSPGKLSAVQKHLNMVGNYIVELKGEEAVSSIEQAREAGVKEEELADLGYLCILTAGIPTWFEISDSLKQINKS